MIYSNKHQTLVVSPNETYIKIGACTVPFIICGVLGFLDASFSLKYVFGLYVTRITQGILIVFINILIFSMPYVFFFVRKKTSALLTQDGVWVLNFGFIPWHMIKEISTYSFGTLCKTIGIYVRDVKFLSKQASLDGRYRLFWAKIFGYPHILLLSMNIPNNEILEFARPFLRQQSTTFTFDTHLLEKARHSKGDYIGFLITYSITFIVLNLIITYICIHQPLLFNPNPEDVIPFISSLTIILLIDAFYQKYNHKIDTVSHHSCIKSMIYILLSILCTIIGCSFIGFTLQDISYFFAQTFAKILSYANGTKT